jgi:hypothetical protein
MRLLGLAIVVAVLACAQQTAAPAGWVLTFWLADGAAPGPDVLSVAEHHACAGKVARARVLRMPSVDGSGPLVPELVVEIDARDAVVARWAMPVDAWVAAVDGDSILVSATSSEVLAISLDGSIRAGESATPPPSTIRPCPRLAEFADSAYVRCSTFEDVHTHAPRHLAYQGPCT